MQKITRLHNLQIEGNPIYYRTDTDDLEILSNILVREEVGCLGDAVSEPKLIVDCGAYGGYSTLYFLTKYKSAHVIAIEADERNFELCRLNLKPYAPRVTLLHAAIWWEPVNLVLRENQFVGIAREWASMVFPPEENETARTIGIDFATLLQSSGYSEIDLLKINVNGVEEQIFSHGPESWLPKVKNIIARLMDLKVEDAFFEAMTGYRFYLSRGSTGLFGCTQIGIAASPGGAHAPSAMDGNAVANGSFEEFRVEPARLFPGGWTLGSNDVAKDWNAVVCDPQFEISLALRTGHQRSGENALRITMDTQLPILGSTAPYAALENTKAIEVHAGEAWHTRAFVKTALQSEELNPLTRGVYIFLRIRYDDGSYADLRTTPLLEQADKYQEIGGIVEIPQSPPGSRLERATLWLYAWIENPEPSQIPPAAYSGWEVFFDDVSCIKVDGS